MATIRTVGLGAFMLATAEDVLVANVREFTSSTLAQVFEYSDLVRLQHPHVWVNTGDRSTQGKAGLLTEWRRTPLGEWEGRVVILNGNFHDPGETLSIVWIKAEYLTPVTP